MKNLKFIFILFLLVSILAGSVWAKPVDNARCRKNGQRLA